MSVIELGCGRSPKGDWRSPAQYWEDERDDLDPMDSLPPRRRDGACQSMGWHSDEIVTGSEDDLETDKVAIRRWT